MLKLRCSHFSELIKIDFFFIFLAFCSTSSINHIKSSYLISHKILKYDLYLDNLHTLRVQLYFGQFFSVSFLTASKNWWKYAHLSGFLAASKNWWKYAHPYSFLAASKNCPKWLLHGRRGGFFSSIYWKIKAFKHEWGVGSPYMPPTKPIGCSETIWSWIQYIWYECKRLHFGSS